MRRFSSPPQPSFALVIAGLFFSGHALAADTTHIVERGHTLKAIAARYHVSVESILKANQLTNGKNLKVGETLIIPDVPKSSLPKAKDEVKPKEEQKPKGDAKAATALKNGDKKDPKKDAKKKEKPITFAARPKTPGVVHVVRVATHEDFAVRVREGGKVPSSASRIFERLMRSTTAERHPIEPRLLSLLGNVSDHFGSRKIEIISGFRPYRTTQYTKHSKHNDGKAIDFRVVGVPNEVLRDYCRTLKNVGVGYYPNSVFVHMDGRETPAFWIDYSKPGEAPRYHSPDVDADEGASDIDEEERPQTPAGGTVGDTEKSEPATTATEKTEKAEKEDKPAPPSAADAGH